MSVRKECKEHTQTIKYNTEDSEYAAHILKNLHCHGKKWKKLSKN
jgi:hypothetical protein